jgi:hypothetical protein
VLAVIDVAEATVNEAAAVPPKETAVAPVRLVPMMETVVPPAVVPLAALTEVMVGVGTT